MKRLNRWLNGVLPAVLLTMPVGSVYAFSLFSSSFAEACGVSMSMMQWAFSLSIFFLGMGAAFFGPVVEKSPERAGKIASFLFTLGLCTTALGVKWGSYWMVLAGYGVLNGLAQGIAYLSPVKALVLWFPKHKGLAASVSIVSFGLGSTLCAWLSDMMKGLGTSKTFCVLACIYAVMMGIGSFLIHKPAAEESKPAADSSSEFSYFSLFKDRMFWHSWLFMFLNISAGLALIGCSVEIFKDAGINEKMILVLMMLAGVFNGSFRLIFAWASDFLKVRINILFAISILSIISILAAGYQYILIGISVLIINACYGGGFSCIAPIIADYYGQNKMSRIHGAVLSAWGFAGLIGNNVSQLVYRETGHYYWVIWVIAVVHAVNAVNMIFARKKFISH